jgi:hypothetical protein
MKQRLILPLLASAVLSAQAANPPAPATSGSAAAAAPSTSIAAAVQTKPKKKGSDFVFSLLPKSLQKNPRLDFNIITDMTPAGKARPQPTAEAPVYYIAQSGGQHNTGVGAEGNLKGPPPENLERMMAKALAEAGYQPGNDAQHRPSIVVIYHWGSSTLQPPADVGDPNSDDPTAGNVPVPELVIRRTLMDRAMLLGGAKFAKLVADAMDEIDRVASLNATATRDTDTPDFMGSPFANAPDPFDRMRVEHPELDRLIDELFSSSYFVVASAYDHDLLAQGKAVLLWRTKMTVNSLGVNMEESVPPLIASAAPYLGRETTDPVLISRRVDREGNVLIGTPTVVEGNVSLPKDTKAAPAKK